MKSIASAHSFFVRLLGLLALAGAVLFAEAPPTMVPPIRGIHEMVGAAQQL